MYGPHRFPQPPRQHLKANHGISQSRVAMNTFPHVPVSPIPGFSIPASPGYSQAQPLPASYFQTLGLALLQRAQTESARQQNLNSSALRSMNFETAPSQNHPSPSLLNLWGQHYANQYAQNLHQVATPIQTDPRIPSRPSFVANQFISQISGSQQKPQEISPESLHKESSPSQDLASTQTQTQASQQTREIGEQENRGSIDGADLSTRVENSRDGICHSAPYDLELAHFRQGRERDMGIMRAISDQTRGRTSVEVQPLRPQAQRGNAHTVESLSMSLGSQLQNLESTSRTEALAKVNAFGRLWNQVPDNEGFESPREEQQTPEFPSRASTTNERPFNLPRHNLSR